MTSNSNNNNGAFVSVGVAADFLGVGRSAIADYVVAMPTSMMDLVRVNTNGGISSVHSSLIPELPMGMGLLTMGVQA